VRVCCHVCVVMWIYSEHSPLQSRSGRKGAGKIERGITYADDANIQ